jgi:tetratricopeptide (TPR) repeat protein
MGQVFRALDERLNRVVAVKVLLPALAGDPVARRRFLREARAAAAVCHENVVTIHAVDEADGAPYLVMQLVAGQSLQQKIDRVGPLGIEEVLRIGIQVASALAAAHAQGLVHRDIKLANILLENGVERVKVTDFGLARAATDAGLTQSGVVAGTPSYMSPEQARGEPIDHRTDLFSLGSVLYAMCTGRPPFRAESAVALLRMVNDDDPRPIRETNPEVPDWLAGVVGKLMAKDPARRYQTAAEVADVLARHLAGLQHPTRPVPAAARPRSFRTMDVAALVLSLAALAIGLVTWWAVHPRHAADLAPGAAARPLAAPSPPVPAPKPAADGGAGDPDLSKALCTLAEDAARKSDHRRALDLFTQAIRQDSKNVPALLGRATVSIGEPVKDWAGAIADASEAVRLDPANAKAFATRAYAECRSNAFRPARDDATEAIRLDPESPGGYEHRGAAYLGLGEWGHAVVDFNESIRRNSKNPWSWYHRATAYYGLNEFDRALADANHAVELAPGNVRFLFLRARLHFLNNQDERGSADLAEAIRLTPAPEKSWAYRLRAEVEIAVSRIEPAIAACNEAIRLLAAGAGPEEARLYPLRAGLYLAHGETDRALGDIDRAIRLDPKPPEPHRLRALVHVRKGRWDEAAREYEVGKTLAGTNRYLTEVFLQGRADALALAGRIEQAEAVYKECIQLDVIRTYPVLVDRAWVIDRPAGAYDAALAKLDETAKSGMIIPFLYRGLIAARLGKPDRALPDFAEVLNRVKRRRDWFAEADYLPRWLALHLGRGEAYLVKGDLDRALTDADEAVRFAPASAEARLLRARIRDKLGEHAPAEADRREAARLAPDPLLALPEPRLQVKGDRP